MVTLYRLRTTDFDSEEANLSKRYWLMKSEPGVYSIANLEADRRTCWDGVRNFQARNLLRDEIQPGDEVLFYHSNANPPGVAGIARVVRSGYPDHTAFDPKDPHFDPKSDPDHPTWFMVDIEFVRRFERTVSLPQIRETEGLKEMVLVKRSRLSVQPVKVSEFEIIRRMADQPA